MSQVLIVKYLQEMLQIGHPGPNFKATVIRPEGHHRCIAYLITKNILCSFFNDYYFVCHVCMYMVYMYVCMFTACKSHMYMCVHKHIQMQGHKSLMAGVFSHLNLIHTNGAKLANHLAPGIPCDCLGSTEDRAGYCIYPALLTWVLGIWLLMSTQQMPSSQPHCILLS